MSGQVAFSGRGSLATVSRGRIGDITRKARVLLLPGASVIDWDRVTEHCHCHSIIILRIYIEPLSHITGTEVSHPDCFSLPLS